MTMMKTEIKAKWLEALRGGEYKQGQGRLVKETAVGPTYCCLGVLCDLAQQEGVVEQKVVPCGCGEEDECSLNGVVGFIGDHDSPDGKHRAHSFSVLPFPVMEWAGLEFPDPMVRTEAGDGYYSERYLSGLNDSGSDFSEIAELIEESL